jgi:predicted ATPase
MQAHAFAGDIAAALQAYEHFRLILDHELAASPAAATQQLHTAILRGELHLPIDSNSVNALRLRPRAPARQRMVAPLPPLVGREQELAQLRARVAALLRREGGVMTLVGEAGIGKSRLVAELQQIAERQGVQILRISCRPTEQNLPLGALSETMQPLIRQAPMPLLRRLPVLALAQFAERVPLLRERLPDLPTLPPLPADEHRARVVDATAELALALARLAPLLVCIDDAQSADATLLAVVGRLARQIAHRAVLVVLAYRAEEVTENPHLHALLRELGREMLIRPLLIGPLDPQAAQQLLVGEASQPRNDRLIERLVEQSTGNPLMLLVATQALLDVHGVRTIAALPADLEVLPLPDLVRAAPIRELVAARVDRLPEAARTLLEQVALLGRPVSLDLIEQLGGPEPLMTAQLLLDRHLLVEGLAERLDLPHDLLRATVLSLIGAPKRRLLHRQIGYALIALHGQRPERAAEIGQHLLRAGLGHEQALQQQAQLAYQYAQQIHADDQARFWAEILQRLDSRRLV